VLGVLVATASKSVISKRKGSSPRPFLMEFSVAGRIHRLDLKHSFPPSGVYGLTY
jgi:hypothetical protein